MITTLQVTCTEYNPEDSDDGTKQLPDWEWKVEGSHLYSLYVTRISYLKNKLKTLPFYNQFI